MVVISCNHHAKTCEGGGTILRSDVSWQVRLGCARADEVVCGDECGMAIREEWFEDEWFLVQAERLLV